MVRVTAIRALENCLDSSPVREYELDGKVNVALMETLAVDSKLQYFPHFPKPYFRIDRPNAWVVQGIIGNRTVRVTFSARAAATAEEDLRCLIES